MEQLFIISLSVLENQNGEVENVLLMLLQSLNIEGTLKNKADVSALYLAILLKSLASEQHH